MAVETRKVEGRRKLKYASLDEVLADAERIGSGPAKQLGNWSPGQVFKHLALAYNGSIDGFTLTFPLPLRLMAKVFKKKLLNGAMPAGFKLPASGAKTLGPAPTSTEDGLADLRKAITRLNQEQRRVNHPMFGELTHEEWNKVHLNHAALHMSFLVPQA